jgi:hypothetical protein
MKKFFAKSFRLIRIILLLILALELVHFSVLANPQKLFNYNLDLGRYKIYSDIPISIDFIQKIIAADKNISQSEVYTASLTANIFICGNEDLYAIFPFLTGMSTMSSGLTISAVNNIFLNVTRIDQLHRYSDSRINYSHLNGNFSQILAHELTHQLITDEMGFWNARKFPRWKAEGYCEYNSTISDIRSDSLYSFAKRCEDYFEHNLYGANAHSRFYYKSQLMVEYLFEIEGISFEEFTSHKLTEVEAFNKLKDFTRSYSE